MSCDKCLEWGQVSSLPRPFRSIPGTSQAFWRKLHLQNFLQNLKRTRWRMSEKISRGSILEKMMFHCDLKWELTFDIWQCKEQGGTHEDFPTADVLTRGEHVQRACLFGWKPACMEYDPWVLHELDPARLSASFLITNHLPTSPL